MSQPIVFLDIDGTLIDVQQRTNADILPILTALQQQGVSFGLNSNRSWEDVEPIIERFHLDGPFILENGAYIKNGTEVFMTPGVFENIPVIVKKAVDEIVLRSFPNADVQSVDTTKIITSEQTKKGNHFYLNQFRKFSASIHHRFNGTSSMHVADELAVQLNQYFSDHHHNLVATAHTHGDTVTVGTPSINKGTGMKFIQQQFPERELIAIGDGSDDIKLRPFVHKLFAVANAIPELKQVANTVSSESMTKGVIELLQQYVQ